MSSLRKGSLRSGSAEHTISLGAKAGLDGLDERYLRASFRVRSRSLPAIYMRMFVLSDFQASGDVGG